MKDIEPHPWGEFLNARYRCILYFIEQGKNFEIIARDLSLEVGQIHSILNAHRGKFQDYFDPPPWEINRENDQKTQGWIERQRWERKQKEEGSL